MNSLRKSVRDLAYYSLSLWALACGGQQVEPEMPAPGASEQNEPAPVATPAAAPQPMPEPATPASQVAAKPTTIKVDGFSTPESVLYDADADLYLVSNINGTPVAMDDNGFISRVTPDGKIAELKWIDGAKDDVKLNAPKGMTISAGVLYVMDIDTMRKFDAKTGEPKGEIKVKGATFLNDVSAAPDGTLYFTDSGLKLGEKGLEPNGTDAVYKLVNDKPKAVIKSKDLKGPNGVLADESGVWIVCFGANELYDVKSGKKADVKVMPKGSLDGIVKTNDGKLLVSSWESNQVFRGSLTEEFTPVVSDVKGPADIGYDSKRNRVLVPLFTENAVVIAPL